MKIFRWIVCQWRGHDFLDYTEDWQDPDYGHGMCRRCGKTY